MNVTEVISTQMLPVAGTPLDSKQPCYPNDHVNMSQ